MPESRDLFFRSLTERNHTDKKFSEKFRKSSVGIAGCGGLGSNIAMILTRAGVGKLILADFDNITLSNLNRQFFFTENLGKPKPEALRENLLKINPYIEIEANNSKITPENFRSIFQNASIIAEAFDDKKEKSMIINTFLDDKSFADRFLVCGSGLGGIDSTNQIQTIRYSNNIFISGDFKSEVKDGYGVLAPRVLLVAAHQANMILRLILGLTEP